MTQVSSTEQRLIAEAPISEQRKENFLASYLSDRSKSGSVEKLFSRAGTFIRVSELGEPKKGFNALMHKGPFVERSNWVEYNTWQFATAQERKIIGELEELLLPTRGSSHPLDANWDSILAQIDSWRAEAADRGVEPTLIVLAGAVTVDMLVDFGIRRLGKESWALPEDLANSIWVHGTYSDLPILLMRESVNPAVYLVDLARFAVFNKYDPEVEFDLQEFTEEQARTQIAKNPNFITVPDVEHPTFEERVEFLRTRVWLKLFESYEMKLMEAEAAFGTELRL